MLPRGTRKHLARQLPIAPAAAVPRRKLLIPRRVMLSRWTLEMTLKVETITAKAAAMAADVAEDEVVTDVVDAVASVKTAIQKYRMMMS
jgi:hypothetical protein